MSCNIDVTYLDEWKNFFGHGITKAGVALTVTGTGADPDCCSFSIPPTAVPVIDTSIGAKVDIIPPIAMTSHKTADTRKPPKCDTVDCCVFTMNYKVSYGLMLPWGGMWEVGSSTGTIQIWATSDGRYGRSI